MTEKDRLRLLVEELSDGEAAEALAYLETRHSSTALGLESAEGQRLLHELNAEWAKVPANVSLTDELLDERRLDAQREAG
jgi:hypothetical protein